MSKTELDNAKHYIRDLVSGSLFVAESKAVAQSLLLDRSDKVWVQFITQDNLLRKNRLTRLSAMRER